MKNFSAKNAEFETLKINNEAAITSANLGTDPNKIPLNKDLGSLAYQDAVNLDDVSADMLELRAIAAEISDSAVDVFVYDTSRDSDGGAWRKRTQHTSWYNEELNTATRGARREFPAVAVIVAEAGRVTIYDGDDPDMGMWMVFDVRNDAWLKQTNNAITVKSVKMLNAKLVTAGYRLSVVDFIDDSGYVSEQNYCYEHNNISRRNIDAVGASTGNIFIFHINTNDVAMTILPNAPIDDDTGLPVATIAVATDGGVSVIKDDGTVVDIVRGTGSSLVNSISFDDHNKLIINNSGTSACYYNIDIPGADLVQTEFGGYTLFSGSIPASNDNLISGSKVLKNYVGHANSGLNILEKGLTDQGDGMIAYTTSKYNTGWMPGDIKLATLSDTTVETIGVNSDELVVDGDNWVGNFNDASDLDSWTESNGGTKSLNGSVIKVVSDTSGDRGSVRTVINTIPGRKYSISAQLVTRAGNSEGFITIYNGDVNSSVEIVSSYPNTFDDGSYINLQFIAQSEQSTIRLVGSAVLGHFTEWDNISVKQTTELITNGDFSIDATAANFATTYPDWGTWLGTCSVDNNKLSAIVSGEGGVAAAATTNFSTVVGQRYVVSFDYGYDGGASHLAFWIDDTYATGQANIYNSGNILSTDLARSRSVSFTATSSTAYLVFIAYGTAGSNVHGEFYNISVRPAVDDRSVNNNGLQIIGEINKAKVAPGADLVAYSGFSTNNYLVQPYNEDLNFGTGDFCS